MTRLLPWWVFALLLLAACVSLKFSEAPFVEGAQLRVFDAYQRLKPRMYNDPPVRIVDIDDESLSRIGQWPWPRTVLADLTNRLMEQGAAAIVYDIVFAEPDRTSPAQIIPLWEKQTGRTLTLGELPDHDQALIDTIIEAPVVSGMVLTHTSSASAKVKSGFAFAGEDPTLYVPGFTGAVTNLVAIETASKGNGALNSDPDFDGIIRRIPLLFKGGDILYPSLATEALRVAQGASSVVVKTVGASGEAAGGQGGITAVKIGRFEIPTDKQGKLWVYFTGHRSERYIPAWKILDGSASPEAIGGQIVLIGTTAAGLKDLRSTPLNPAVGGVEVHAQAIEQVLEGVFLTQPDWIFGAEIILTIVSGLLILIVASRLHALPAAAFMLLVAALVVGFSWWQFSERHLLVEPVTPIVAVILLYFFATIHRFAQTERERSRIKSTFGLYLSPALVEELAEHPERLELGGENREISILFCDIRNFSGISEKLEPTALTRLVNRFLTPMTDIILAHGGTIDKYIGDSIMALWNAPLDIPHHPQRAAEAALAMRAALNALNEELKNDPDIVERIALPIKIGIGINTAVCCVGNLGSNARFEYSALGNGVDMASRLEGLCKLYGVETVLGPATVGGLQGMATLELDLIAVKGKTQPAQIYTLLGDRALAQQTGYSALVAQHADLLQAYRSQTWDRAEMQIAQCRSLASEIGCTQLAIVYQLYESRIEEARLNPPHAGWNGVYVATMK